MKKLTKRIIIYPLAIATFASGLLVSCKRNSSENSSSSEPSSSMPSSSSEPSSNISSSNSETVQDVVVISVTQEEITIENENIFKYDYTSLFIVTVNDEPIEVTNDMVDASKVVNKAGTYDVTCSYKGEIATVKVTVEMVETVKITAKVNSLELKLKEVDDYDFLSLFTITEKGRPVTVNSSMITSTVKKEEGNYTVTCTYKDVNKVIDVVVTSSYKIEIIESYKEFELTLSELENFDYTKLFSLFVDDVFTPVTLDMIDKSSVTNPSVGSTFEIKCSYSIEESSKEKTTTIKIIDEKEVSVNASGTIVYPNDKTIDLTTLFTITDDGKKVAVTHDMIKGSVNYDVIGNNEITCTYKGITKTANVEVKKGVRIQYATSSTVVINYGTNQQTYNFANDFAVSVNGVKFSLNNSFVDTSKVDFTKEGEYVATITVPYGENQVVDGNSTLVDYTLDITYVVTKINAVVRVRDENVILNSFTSSYDYLKNIVSTVNGNNMIVTSNRDWASDPTCTYVEVVSDPVDFSKPGVYEIECHAYPYGLDEDPIVIKYNITIDNGVEIKETTKATLFVGQTAYPKDYFEVTKNGQPVEVTNDMIEGKVDCSKPGVYELVLTYEGKEGVATVVVLDSALKGTYSTANMTIVEVSSSSSDTSDDEYSESTGEDTEEEVVLPEPLGKLIIDDTGVKTLDDKKGVWWEAIDKKTIMFSLGGFDYYMHVDEKGIVSCRPINENHMQYTDFNRPYVYFKDDEWVIEDKLTINTSSNHVFACSSVATSIDLVKIKNLNDNTIIWYGSKYQLIEKTQADYFYKESHFILDNDEIPSELVVGSTYSISCDNEVINFKMTSENTGKVIKIDDYERKYANMSFAGIIDGKEATLAFNQYQNLTLLIEGKQIFSTIYASYSSTKIGGIDYINNTIKVYSEEEGYSYDFVLDLDNNTFTVKEKTGLCGLFKANTTSSLSNTGFFFDGYGSGTAMGLDSNSTYTTYAFSYYEENGVVYISFDNVKDTFAYKDGIIFRIDVFKNVLRVADCANNDMIDIIYNNVSIENGVQIDFTNTILNMSETLEEFLEDLYASITITSKDGLVLDEDKAEYVDYSYIDFEQAGLYSVGIKAMVDGKEVVKYYAIQILEPLYEDHELIGNYTSSTNSRYTFEFDKFGNGKITYYNTVSDHASYEGAVIFTDETNFVFTGIGIEDPTKTISVTGVMETDDVVSLKISGNKELISYFYTSEVESLVTGISKNYIRAFTKGETTTYFYSTNVDTTGQKVTVTSLNGVTPTTSGAVIQVINASNEIILTAKVLGWNSVYSGLQLADSYKGEYTNDSSTLTLDGFGVSENKLGEASLNNEIYAYYLYNNEIVELLDVETNEIKGYVILDTNTSSFSILEKSYSDSGITGNFGVLSYNEVSTSKHNLFIDEYGVGYYTTNTSSEDDSSDSTTNTTSKYVGRITNVTGNVYTFEGYLKNKPEVKAIVSFSKKGDSIIEFNLNTGEGMSDSGIMIANSISVKYIANQYADYLLTVQLEDRVTYFYCSTNQSIPQIAILTEIEGTFGEVGSIFTVKVGSTTVIDNALYTGSSMTTKTGYVYANELKGEYVLETSTNSILKLDGFANIEFNTIGKATLTAGTRITEYQYEEYYDNIIKVFNSKTTLYYEIDKTNNTFKSISSSSYRGDLIGTYDMVSIASNSSISFNGYSLATYSYGSSTYNCVVTHDTTTNSFTLVGDMVKDIYGSTISIIGKELTSGVLKLTITRNSTTESYYFICSTSTFEIYSGETYTNEISTIKATNIIYKVTFDDTNEIYLLSPTNTTTYNEVVNITKEDDSLVDLGNEGAIFKVSDSSGTIFVASYISNSLNGGFIKANLDERNTFISNDGKTLFTNGFTTSKNYRSSAILDGQSYEYYYSSSIENTIVLYNADGTIAHYVEIDYDNMTFKLSEKIFDESSIFLRKFVGMYSANNEFIIDEYGYGSVTLFGKVYDGKFTFNEDFTNITFVGGKSDEINKNVICTIKVLKDGVVLLDSEGDELVTQYFTVGEYSMYGYRWANFVYSTTIDGVTSYFYAPDRGNNVSTYVGEVNVELYDENIPFGVEGCIFIVKSLDGTITYLTGRISPETPRPGNEGYDLADEVIGKYSHIGKDNLELDGFGNAKVGEVEGTYTFLENLVVFVSIDNETYTYIIDRENDTYIIKEEDVLKEKSFTYHKLFANGNEGDLILTFDGLSTCTIYFKGDEGNIGGYEEKLITGMYTLVNDLIVIRVHDGSSTYNIKLAVDDISNPTQLTCTATNIFYINEYYFEIGSIFK